MAGGITRLLKLRRYLATKISLRRGGNVAIPPSVAGALGYDILPLGRHVATFDEIRAKLVDGAPHSDARRLIFDALVVYADLVWRLLPTATLWVDGGFVTWKPDPPHDVDVLIVVEPTTPVVSVDDLAPLLTHREVNYELPIRGFVSRLQPMGGLVDGWLTSSGNQDMMSFWDGWWSTLEDVGTGELKGYLEVTRP